MMTNLKKLIRLSDKKQIEIAKELNITNNYLIVISNNHVKLKRVSGAMRERLEKYFGKDFSYLCSEEN